MLYDVEQTITFVAWDTGNSTGKTGDSDNFTLRWIKDGTASAPTNSASEVDATNAPGIYKITLTAAETQCLTGTLAGNSSTADIEILPVQLDFVRLPNATPGASGGVSTFVASSETVNIGKVAGSAISAVSDLQADVSALATATELAKAVDRSGYCLTILAGTISTAGTATETFDLTIDSVAHRVVVSGLDTDGNRSGQALSKP